ncbi:50S ribosomal protein L9 [Parasphingopyxis lamellibrachiae]|uniref:Large ribosomal subunit protein bL9 n=1 Tax=Parasphingopyxis lamellibrachiae TaxID=680125 RepID=A0A3D9FDK5_9SPHN|nr:50S ribosomal protein L9 [Parasphingopyxis lamellibrachiae]RED15904.1 LSU ribosomal protein L9P [Parasphingopyxis lamellibrachiae]
MDIILLERVGNLGTIGDVVTVKDGFARNFLLPNKKALRANKANKAIFEANREQLEKENEERRAVAETEGAKIDGMTIELIRQASNTGQLYGSVSVRDIIVELEAKGEAVSKKQVVLERPIKAVGVHEVRIALHAEVDATIKVNVARSPEEAELQAQGVDVLEQMFEKDEQGFTEEFDPNAEPGEIAAVGEEEDFVEPVPAPEASDDTAAEDADEADAEAAAEEDGDEKSA